MIKGFIKYGIVDRDFYKEDIEKLISDFKIRYYDKKTDELSEEIENIEKYLRETDDDLLENFCKNSMKILKNKLALKYKVRKREIFSQDDLERKGARFLDEYPVILSTTFSSTNNVKDTMYDYLIMDEASQADILTGALSLSCAKNVVIV